MAEAQTTDVQAAFQAIVEADERQRGSMLDDLQQRSPTSAAEVRRLLAAHDLAEGGGFLDGVALDQVWSARTLPLRTDFGVGPASVPPELPDFRRRRFLGRGGFGEVWIVENLHTGEIQAAKFIPDPEGLELAGLKHIRTSVGDLAGLVPIDHVGRVGDWLYATMPLADAAEGTGPVANLEHYRPLTLQAYAARSVRAGASDVAAIGATLAGTLAELHARGLVHGDVKPENVLAFGGSWRLGDYSLVRSVGTAGRRVGTPDYLAPEGPGGVAGDQFALAVTLFVLLTGRPAGEFQAWRDLAAQTGSRAPEGPLGDILRRAGAISASDRFSHMREFQRALAGTMAVTAGRRAPRMGPRRLARRVVGATVVLLALGGAALGLFASGVFDAKPPRSPVGEPEPDPAQPAPIRTAVPSVLDADSEPSGPSPLERFITAWADQPIALLMLWPTTQGERWVRSDLRLIARDGSELTIDTTGARWPNEGATGWESNAVLWSSLTAVGLRLTLQESEFEIAPGKGEPVGDDRVDWADLRAEGWDLREYHAENSTLIVAYPPAGAILYSTMQARDARWSNRVREDSWSWWEGSTRLPDGRIAFDVAALAGPVPAGVLGHLPAGRTYMLRGRVALSARQLDQYHEARNQSSPPILVSIVIDGTQAALLRLDSDAPIASIDLPIPEGASTVSFSLVGRPPFVTGSHLAFLDVRLVPAPE